MDFLKKSSFRRGMIGAIVIGSGVANASEDMFMGRGDAASAPQSGVTKEITLNKIENWKLNSMLNEAHEIVLKEFGSSYDKSLDCIDSAIRDYNDGVYNTFEYGVSPNYLQDCIKSFDTFSAGNWNWVMLQEYMKAESAYGRLGFISDGSEAGLSTEQKIKNRAEFALKSALDNFTAFRKFRKELERARKDIITYMSASSNEYSNVAMSVSKRKARVAENERTYKNGDYDRSSTYNNARVYAQEGEVKRHTNDMEMNAQYSSAYDKTNGDYEYKKTVDQVYQKEGKNVAQFVQNKGNVRNGTYNNVTVTQTSSKAGDTTSISKQSKQVDNEFNCYYVNNEDKTYRNGKEDETLLFKNSYFTDVLTNALVLDIKDVTVAIRKTKLYKKVTTSHNKEDFSSVLAKLLVDYRKKEKGISEQGNKVFAEFSKNEANDIKELKRANKKFADEKVENYTQYLKLFLTQMLKNTKFAKDASQKDILNLVNAYVGYFGNYVNPTVLLIHDTELSYTALVRTLDDLYDYLKNLGIKQTTKEYQTGSVYIYTHEELQTYKDRLQQTKPATPINTNFGAFNSYATPINTNGFATGYNMSYNTNSYRTFNPMGYNNGFNKTFGF